MIGRGSAWPLPSRRRSSSRSAASSAGISGPGPAISLLSPHDTAVVTLPEEALPEAGDNQLSLQELIMIFVAAAPSQSGTACVIGVLFAMADVMYRAVSHEAVPDRELSGRGCRPLCPNRSSQTGVNCLRCCSTPEEQLWEGPSWHGVLDKHLLQVKPSCWPRTAPGFSDAFMFRHLPSFELGGRQHPVSTQAFRSSSVWRLSSWARALTGTCSQAEIPLGWMRRHRHMARTENQGQDSSSFIART